VRFGDLTAQRVAGSQPNTPLATLTHHHAETTDEKIDEHDPNTDDHDGLPATRLSAVSGDPRPRTEPAIEQKMWVYWITQRFTGRTLTGAELARVFSTNNYGRGVLRQ